MNGRQAREVRRRGAERDADEWRAIAVDAVEALRLLEMQRPLNALGEQAIRRFEAKVDAATLEAMRRKLGKGPGQELLERTGLR